jgi:rhodanese-related sulfurtransferase
MADIQRVDAQQAHTKAKSNQALLVCAYEDEAKCRMLNLDGSVSFANFKSRVNSLPKSQEIIFYWAWPAEASAVGQAAKYQAQGFTNVKVLKGGVEAWKAAGYAMNWSLHAAIPANPLSVLPGSSSSFSPATKLASCGRTLPNVSAHVTSWSDRRSRPHLLFRLAHVLHHSRLRRRTSLPP